MTILSDTGTHRHRVDITSIRRVSSRSVRSQSGNDDARSSAILQGTPGLQVSPHSLGASRGYSAWLTLTFAIDSSSTRPSLVLSPFSNPGSNWPSGAPTRPRRPPQPRIRQRLTRPSHRRRNSRLRRRRRHRCRSCRPHVQVGFATPRRRMVTSCLSSRRSNLLNPSRGSSSRVR